MDITETDTTRAESDKVIDPAADREDLANATKATEVGEGDNGEANINSSSKQDISHTEVEGDHHLDQQAGATNNSRDRKKSDSVMTGNSLLQREEPDTSRTLEET